MSVFKPRTVAEAFPERVAKIVETMEANLDLPVLRYTFPLANANPDLPGFLDCTMRGRRLVWDVRGRSPSRVTTTAETIETLVRAWFDGNCAPPVVADAIEERLEDADQVCRAEWLLRLLRGDPQWEDAVRPALVSSRWDAPPADIAGTLLDISERARQVAEDGRRFVPPMALAPAIEDYIRRRDFLPIAEFARLTDPSPLPGDPVSVASNRRTRGATRIDLRGVRIDQVATAIAHESERVIREGYGTGQFALVGPAGPMDDLLRLIGAVAPLPVPLRLYGFRVAYDNRFPAESLFLIPANRLAPEAP